MHLADLHQPSILLSQLLCICVCFGGDHLLSHSNLAAVAVYRAVTDSATHGLIGMLSWCIVIGPSIQLKSLIEIVFCGFLSCTVDVDHFIEAKSLHIEDATKLDHRPFLHNSSVIPMVFIILLCLRQFLHRLLPMPIMLRLPWIFFIAFSSHHIRDATRRGLWLAPFGSTPALPQWVYIGLIATIPLILRLCSMDLWPDMLHLQEKSLGKKPQHDAIIHL